MGKILGELLRSEIGSLPMVGEVRGRGLFWAIEFMQDVEIGVPFSPEAKFCDKIVNKSLSLGLNILGNLGQTGSVHIEHVIVSPPYIVNEDQLCRIVSILRTAIKAVSAEFTATVKARAADDSGVHQISPSL